jgi:hypothetical protein
MKVGEPSERNNFVSGTKIRIHMEYAEMGAQTCLQPRPPDVRGKADVAAMHKFAPHLADACAYLPIVSLCSLGVDSEPQLTRPHSL